MERLIVNDRECGLVNSMSIKCPYCHMQHVMNGCYMLGEEGEKIYYITAKCLSQACRLVFIVRYDEGSHTLHPMEQSMCEKINFSKTIKDLSADFCNIYNEAYAAEQMVLMQITGVGYRKALEFLIKDYLIYKTPGNKDAIKNKLLMQCINDDVDDKRIKEIARRATWLGNDETHYTRKWEGKDVSHLKDLINMCLYWIEAEVVTAKILEEMPAPKSRA
ncbi:MAG: hypothetical protein SNJ29_10315 [Rikenellaceae bacterium]